MVLWCQKFWVMPGIGSVFGGWIYGSGLCVHNQKVTGINPTVVRVMMIHRATFKATFLENAADKCCSSTFPLMLGHNFLFGDHPDPPGWQLPGDTAQKGTLCIISCE